MFKVTISSAELAVKEGISQRTRKPYKISEQTGYIHLPAKPYPVECKFALPDGQAAAYPPGEYVLAPDSFYIDRFHTLKISPRLVKSTAAASLKAA